MKEDRIEKCIAFGLTVVFLIAIVLCAPNPYRGTVLRDGYTLQSSVAEGTAAASDFMRGEDGKFRYVYLGRGEELPKELVYVIKNEEEEKECFSAFTAKIDYEKETLIVCFVPSTNPRSCNVTKTKKEKGVLRVCLAYDIGHYFRGADACAPKVRCFVIRVRTAGAKDIRVYL